jgi:hypothetical protein
MAEAAMAEILAVPDARDDRGWPDEAFQ